jgi:site-specific DNA-methyltransferase (adenine-specific)
MKINNNPLANLAVNYNPDVLTCLSNLSNDEVFTPPELVNKILNQLPSALWKNKEIKFLDPVSKSGVFLREIAKRLIVGLEDEIPDIQIRIDHILKNQLFGIAITELTSFLSRRSIYCSKIANNDYSICTKFNNHEGNIRFKLLEHTWDSGKCIFCGAVQEIYERTKDAESYAYEFIHTEKPETIFGNNMQFDVIVGNPPYQLSDGGFGASASPIYHKFVEQAKKLNPRFITMIIPARWYSGGKGLDNFRNNMLSDKRIKQIHDFFDSTICFPGVDISGGVCYFLWDRDNPGDCQINSYSKDGLDSSMVRPLLEEGADTFIRRNEAIPIINKITAFKEECFSNLVSRSPFELPTNFTDFKKEFFAGSIKVYAYPKAGYILKNKVPSGHELIDKYKVFISEAYGERGSFPYLITAKPFLGGPGTACTLTYLVIGAFETEKMALNLISYIRTRFFRFLILQKKNTQHTAKKVYSFVPMQDFSESWSDEKLYQKYNLNKNEIKFIESMIRPMEPTNE